MMIWFIWILIHHEMLTLLGKFSIKYTGYLAALIATEQEPHCFRAARLHQPSKSCCSDFRSYKKTVNPKKQSVCILDIQGTQLPPMSHTHLHVLASARQHITGELVLIFYGKGQNQARAGMCWTSKHVNPWNEWDLNSHPWFFDPPNMLSLRHQDH